MDHIAETVGLAAVRYYDLSHSLASDYKFDFATMLSLEGNTTPYMLYAYARIRSIARKANVDFAVLATETPIVLKHPSEIALALKPNDLLGIAMSRADLFGDDLHKFMREGSHGMSSMVAVIEDPGLRRCQSLLLLRLDWSAGL